MKVRPIAIYLPQFHPVAENDEWWGKGFTEWTNVTRAQPLYKGHYQPHLPADLGFYDLRVAESRLLQAELARSYGIHGFCYYHYWFNGRRILEKPFQEVFESGKPDFPFMLCWANENWTRRWDGGDETVLLRQTYSAHDAYEHIRYLINIFKDERYIRINGRPVFAFYRTAIIPNLAEYVKIFREEAGKEGIDLYLCKVESFGSFGRKDMDHLDAAIEFQPFTACFGEYVHQIDLQNSNTLSRRVVNKLLRLIKMGKLPVQRPDYATYLKNYLENYQYPQDYKRFPCVMPGFDNTARRGEQATLLKNSTPQKFGEWVRYHKQHFVPHSQEENLLFINAWNEWAEGNHLEPCSRWGHDFLINLQNNLS